MADYYFYLFFYYFISSFFSGISSFFVHLSVQTPVFVCSGVLVILMPNSHMDPLCVKQDSLCISYEKQICEFISFYFRDVRENVKFKRPTVTNLTIYKSALILRLIHIAFKIVKLYNPKLLSSLCVYFQSPADINHFAFLCS